MEQANEIVTKFVTAYAEVLCEELFQIDTSYLSEEAKDAIRAAANRLIEPSLEQFRDTQVMKFPSTGLKNIAPISMEEVKQDKRIWIAKHMSVIVDTIMDGYRAHGTVVLDRLPAILDQGEMMFPEGDFGILDFRNDA